MVGNKSKQNKTHKLQATAAEGKVSKLLADLIAVLKSPAKAIPYLDDNTIASQAWLEENFNGDQKLFNITIWTAHRRLLAERRAWFKAASAASRSDKTWGYVANTKGLLPQDKIAAQERLKDLDTFLKNLPESLRYKVDEIKPQESHGAHIIYPTLLPVLLQK